MPVQQNFVAQLCSRKWKFVARGVSYEQIQSNDTNEFENDSNEYDNDSSESENDSSEFENDSSESEIDSSASENVSSETMLYLVDFVTVFDSFRCSDFL